MKLIDDHRAPWAKYLGQTKVFRGTFSRFGHKHRQGERIQRGATFVLTDVHLKGSKFNIDHAWIDYTPNWAIFGQKLQPGAEVEFTAKVNTYVKGGKNSYGKTVGTYDDLELTNARNIRILKSKRLAKTALIGDNLVSYAIGTHTNTKSGIFLGIDPQEYLGKIYVGQTFANRLARRLTYEYSARKK